MTPSAWSEEKLNSTISNNMQLLAAAISKEPTGVRAAVTEKIKSKKKKNCPAVSLHQD